MVRSQAINREPVAAKLEKKRSSVGSDGSSGGIIIGVLENGDLKMVKVQSLTKSRFESPEGTKL
jgi:hypothetical protein